MSEKEFWTKYCRAEYLLATHKSAEAFAEAADDEDLVMFVREDTQLNEEAKKKVRGLFLYVIPLNPPLFFSLFSLFYPVFCGLSRFYQWTQQWIWLLMMLMIIPMRWWVLEIFRGFKGFLDFQIIKTICGV